MIDCSRGQVGACGITYWSKEFWPGEQTIFYFEFQIAHKGASVIDAESLLFFLS